MIPPGPLHIVPREPATVGHGQITTATLRHAFPQWQAFEHDGTWWAARGGTQEWAGPRSLLRRVLASADLTVLAEKLCVQDWLDNLDDDALTAVYQANRTQART